MATIQEARVEEVDDSPRPIRANGLDALFAPNSIAIVGASEKPGSIGRALTENIRRFPGKTYLINPNHSTVLGARAFPDIASLPEKVDLAVIAAPAASVPEIVRQCVAVGVRGIVVISAGFKECGNAGAQLELQILREIQPAGLRLVGPNCLGVMIPRTGLNATFAAGIAKPGSVAFLSQSGALCTAVLDWSHHEDVGFSAFVSVGSMLDVGWGDLINYFGEDPNTSSIVCYMESVGDARKFLSAARGVSLTKPIIVLKVGRTEAAAKAAASHTGALTGSDAVLDAAFRRAGVLRVATIEELFDMAEVLAKQSRPKGPRLAIVTNAGGPAALATDALVSSGAQIAELTAATLKDLSEFLPSHWSHGNPIDILGDADAERYARAVALAANDPNADGLLVVLTPQAMTDPTDTAKRLRTCAQLVDKPILASWMGGPAIETGEAILNSAGIPNFRYPDRAARAFELMWRYSKRLHALGETPPLLTDTIPAGQCSAAGKIIDAARAASRALLTEAESKQMLAAYGIKTVETRVALTEEAAVECAKEIGFPVVLKLLSQTITHKSDVGGVQLDLRDAGAVQRAFQAIRTSLSERGSKSDFLGVTVQPMVRGNGYELILGSSVDPQFGPVIAFGAGGQLVEVLKDSALALPPLNATLARRLIEQTRIHNALKGVRGRKPVDLDALATILVRFSEMVVCESSVSEVDINPLWASEQQIIALDARIMLGVFPPAPRLAGAFQR